MKSALCPLCGSDLQLLRVSFRPALSCLACGWKSGSNLKEELTDHAGAPTSFLNLLPTGEEGRDIFGSLLNVPRPRPLRWTWHMKIAVTLLALAIALVIWVLASSSGKIENVNDDLSTLMIFLICFAVAVSFPLIPELSNRKLLTDGELVVGRVVRVEAVQRGRKSWSIIFYAFADAANRGYIGAGKDFSDSLAQGAPVVVFYDPLNPRKNAALESSRLGVRLP